MILLKMSYLITTFYMCGSTIYLGGCRCRLYVKAIYLLLCKAIYYLFNIFKERKSSLFSFGLLPFIGVKERNSIVCKLSTRVYIVKTYKEYILFTKLFPCEKTTQAIWLKRLGNEELSPYFIFALEIIQCLLIVL